MYKHSPSRNQRSKGIKVKHVLQICLLVAVCFWLIYQVKRSHDKRKEFDEHDAKISQDEKHEIVKLGRKDLNPRVEETIIKEVEVEEEEEEENKHEEEEQEDNNKTEEKDDGDVDEENDRGEEDTLDDEKEISDEQENEEKDTEDDTNNNKQTENQDREGGARNTHEAREENYKADDASSAVTGISEKSNQESIASQNTSVKVENSETVNNTSSNSNLTKGSVETTLQVPNIIEGDKIAIKDPNLQISDGDKIAMKDPNLQLSDPTPEKNSTLANQNNQHDSNSTFLKESEDTGSNHGEDTEASEDLKEDETGEINEGLDGSDSENLDEVPHDPIDSSDSSIFLEEKDVRMDLETLPEIQIEGSNSEDAAE